MEFDFEFDSNVVVVAGIFWVILLASVWYLPATFGWQEYSLFMKITISVLGAPLCYLIVNFINNR